MSDVYKNVEQSGIVLYDDHILVLLEENAGENKSAGGLLLGNSEKDEPMIGQVIMVGTGKRNEKGEIIPIDIKIKTKVMFKKWAGTKLSLKPFGIEEGNFVIVKASEIMLGGK
ncbi:MAG: co-chaperone GroES family protein [Anaplasmataceae bacterium]|nr:co-chaperone GroES family protein [Anaplasmataceae bacterium]